MPNSNLRRYSLKMYLISKHTLDFFKKKVQIISYKRIILSFGIFPSRLVSNSFINEIQLQFIKFSVNEDGE